MLGFDSWEFCIKSFSCCVILYFVSLFNDRVLAVLEYYYSGCAVPFLYNFLEGVMIRVFDKGLGCC